MVQKATALISTDFFAVIICGVAYILSIRVAPDDV
jgi:hypothetical protein